MASNLLTISAAPGEESAEFAVAAGAPVGLCLKGALNTARVALLKKDDAGVFQPTAIQLTAAAPDGTLVGPGVYKVQRRAGTCGVFRD